MSNFLSITITHIKHWYTKVSNSHITSYEPDWKVNQGQILTPWTCPQWPP